MKTKKKKKKIMKKETMKMKRMKTMAMRVMKTMTMKKKIIQYKIKIKPIVFLQII